MSIKFIVLQAFKVAEDGVFDDYVAAKAVYSKVNPVHAACLIQLKDGIFTVVESYGISKEYYEQLCSNLFPSLNGRIFKLI